MRAPIEPMLAAPVESLGPIRPGAPGWFEPKYDGYRALVCVDEPATRIWSRRGHDITGAFPEIAGAARESLEPGTVLDGEILIWTGAGFDFPALQRRLAAGRGSSRGATRMAREQPASMIAFDLLARGGTDLLTEPLRARRAALEALALAPPIQVTPRTIDIDEARAWVEDYRQAEVGIEGLVIKDPQAPYEPGRRGWAKYRIRDTHEVIVGAVTGTVAEPRELIVGLLDPDTRRLEIAGATTPLDRRQRAQVAALLRPAVGEHPWPSQIGSGRLGRWDGAPREVVLVEPLLVIEVSADTAREHGRWRHVVRFVRPRPDLTPAEI